MVNMHVGADHGIDAVAGPSRRLEGLKEICGQGLATEKAARPIIADAGIDDQAKSRRLDEQGVDGEQHLVLLIDKIGIEPRNSAQGLRRGIRDKAALFPSRDLHLRLNNAGNLYRTYLPTEHFFRL